MKRLSDDQVNRSKHVVTSSPVTQILAEPWTSLIVGLQGAVVEATHDFWVGSGAVPALLPVTTGAVSSPMGRGSDSLPVAVDIGGERVYLADSAQFYLELLLRVADRPCFYLMPSFRGEPADETHLPQFFHMEAELDGGLDDVIVTAERYLRAVVGHILDGWADRLRRHGRSADHLRAFVETAGRLPRLTFDEVARMVPEHIVRHPGWRTITRAGELRLLERVGGPAWITEFDHLSVPFYQAFRGGDDRVAANADLILGVGELIGAGERHTDSASLSRALDAHEVDPAAYAWYLEMKQLAPRRTAGFGMGVERFLAWVVQCPDIRAVQFIPRSSPDVTI